MLAAVGELRRRHPDLSTMVAAIDQRAFEALKTIEARQGTKLADADYRSGQLDAVLTHADVVLAVSGTVTLDIAAHRKPMVVLYNVGWWSWNLIGRLIVSTRTFTLPNLIGEWDGRGRIVPELVPHFGEVEPVVEAVDSLIRDEAARREQREELERLCSHFEGKPFGKLAADKVVEVLEA
jgi:lipid-A-disaccharide synthase